MPKRSPVEIAREMVAMADYQRAERNADDSEADRVARDLVRMIDDPTAWWMSLTDEQRSTLAAHCCRGCGSLDTGCQCWNDE